MPLSATSCRVIFAACLLSASPAQSDERVTPVPREAALTLLRHHADLMRSAECRFKRTRWPTREEMIPLIDEMCKVYGGTLEQYVISEERARAKSYECFWQRKGSKEREELLTAGRPEEERSIRTFDGQLVRWMGRTKKSGVVGRIGTVKTSPYRTNRPQPFSLLYEYVHLRSYADVVEGAHEFHGSMTEVDGKPRLTFSTLKLVGETQTQWQFVFDEEQRLVERTLRKGEPDKPLPLREKHVLLDYQAYPHESGETIWFPGRAEYYYCLGETEDGTPVEWCRETYEVEDIRFNIDIPDARFVLDFPDDIPVFDSVAGLGRIDPADRPLVEAGSSSSRASSRLLWAAGPLVLLLVVMACLWAGRQYRRRRA